MITILEWTIRVSILLLAALAALVLLRKHSAALRHWALTAALGAAVFVPLLNVVVPAWEFEGLRRLEPPASTAEFRPSESWATSGSLYEGPVPIPSQPVGVSAAITPVRAPSRFHLRDLLPILWFAGVAVGLFFLLAGSLRLAWIASRSKPVTTGNWPRLAAEISETYGLRRPLRILTSPHPSILATWGIARPEVLLPSGAADWPEERIRVVLSHELAHIQRCDWLVQVSAGILRAVYWFNPLIWIVYNRLCRESEHACDDTVIAGGTAGPDYAKHLLEVARILSVAEPAWAPGLLMARRSTLQQRITATLNPRLNRRYLSRPAMTLTLVSFMAVSLPVAALRAVSPRTSISTARLASPAPGAESMSVPLASAAAAVVGPFVQAPASSPASVEGVVVREGTREPLAGVLVEVRRVAPGALLARPFEAAQITSVTTGPDGRFVFRDLQPADYRLVAYREDGAFATVEYLQRPTQLLGVIFPLAAGQNLKDVRLEMRATGSISGRIIDRDGEPVGYARVMALQHWYEKGAKMMSLVQVGFTNDRGEYRLYWLPAGQYFIAVRPESGETAIARTLPNVVNIASPRGEYRAYEGSSAPPLTRRLSETGQFIEETYQLVYYGGGADAQRARVIEVTPGAHVNAIDVSVAPGTVRARTIRGTVINGVTGQPAAGADITAIPRDASPSLILPMTRTGNDGAFTLKGLTPEAYTLVATQRGNSPASGKYKIDAGSNDIDGFTANLRPGVSISGRFVFDGRIPDGVDLSRIGVDLAPVEGFPLTNYLPQNRALATADLRFTLMNVSPADAAFKVGVGGLPPGAGLFVKSIRWAGTDVLNSPLRLGSELSGSLEVTLGSGLSTLETLVLDSNLRPSVNAVVVLVPEPSLRTRLDLYKSRSTNTLGQLVLPDVVPGDYKLFAWDEIKTGAWLDGDFIKSYENLGKPIHIREASRETAELSLIRAGR